jgi:peptide/nickel transport system ATP-binding protein
MTPPLLEIRDLSVSFSHPHGVAHAVRGLDFVMRPGEVHSLVGESGSGKTVMTHAVLGLLAGKKVEVSGSAKFGDEDLLSLSDEGLRRVRGAQIGMIFQEPSRYLNPAFTIGNQITEMLRVHQALDRRAADARAAQLLELVGLGQDLRVVRSYAHELSGGMRQRAMIAMAASCSPALLIADEPTTALDVTVEKKILELLLELKNRLGMSMLFISHNLAVVQEISDRVSVIYMGRIVESGSRTRVFAAPIHPYTRLLLDAIPDPDKRGQRLASIPGSVPDAENVPDGCAFHTRCPFAAEACGIQEPDLAEYDRGNGEPHLAACLRIGELE